MHLTSTGSVEGTTTGKTFAFRVRWNAAASSVPATGDYIGAFDEDGRISGSTSDLRTGERADWTGDRPANCIVVAAAHCEAGYVWRDNFDGDTVCVRPDERHRLANGTCSPGYVWRDTFDGDTVCVTPAQREAAKAQKRRDDLGIVTRPRGPAENEFGVVRNRNGAAEMSEPAEPANPQHVLHLPQAPPTIQYMRANDDVDVYQGPGQEPIIGKMSAGAEALILGNEGDWWKLQLDVPGGSGWVSGDHLWPEFQH
jgi:hypothetical protein